MGDVLNPGIGAEELFLKRVEQVIVFWGGLEGLVSRAIEVIASF